MKKLLFACLFCAAMFLAVSLSTVNAAPGDKVTVCHIPPGNPGNAHAIEVGESSVAAHLDHGDTLGPCVAEPPDCDLDPDNPLC